MSSSSGNVLDFATAGKRRSWHSQKYILPGKPDSKTFERKVKFFLYPGLHKRKWLTNLEDFKNNFYYLVSNPDLKNNKHIQITVIWDFFQNENKREKTK